MKICCIADTHRSHRECKLPSADVLVFAGDGMSNDFAAWLRELPYEHKIIVGGNHDMCLQNNREYWEKQISPAVYLQDKSYTIGGIKFYGAPWNTTYDCAFYADENLMIHKWYDLMPDDIDILITHTPPYGVLDKSSRGIRHGCPILAERLKTMNLKYHIFGHVHYNHGIQENSINCSQWYNDSKPFVIDIKARKL